jgi:hypothetical protein
MKIVAPFLVVLSLVGFTDPLGHHVYVARAQVVSVTEPIDCTKTAHAKINIGSGSFLCVQETVDEVIRALEH